MAKVTSKHKGPLGLPGGITLRPGVPTNVERWGIIKNHAVVRSWVNSGVIESDEKSDEPKVPAPSGEPTPVDDDHVAVADDEALAKLKAEAKELGISIHYRWSAEKIQEEIDKKLAE